MTEQNISEINRKRFMLIHKDLESDFHQKCIEHMKRHNKLKDDFKKECKLKNIKELVIDNYKVSFEIRENIRADVSLLDPEELDKIKIKTEIWWGFYKKI